MLLVIILAALFSAVLTAAALMPFGITIALAAAPFGGSAVVVLVALLTYLKRDHGPSSRHSAPVGCSR